MKQLKIFFLPLIILLVGFSSCLKKATMNTDPANSPAVIGFANTGDNFAATTSTYPEFHMDLGSLKSGASVTFNINVEYDGAGAASSDITVNLSLDQAALTLYNTQNGTNYVIPPSAVYSFPSSVVIKSGTRTAHVQATINNNSSYNFNDAYAIPIQISSVSGGAISANFGKAIYSFGLRNIYDGHYSVTANSPMVDAASAGIVGNYPMDVYLVTIGANSVVMIDNAIGTYAHSIRSGGNLSYYGSFAPVFNFDPSSNGVIVSVTNFYGQPAGNGRSAQLDPSGVNKWDPITKLMKVKYWMNQPSVISPHRTYFDETFTYLGPR